MTRRRRQQRGSAMVEFVLTGIPLIFVWISVVQMSLGMWHYHTLQYAVKAAGTYIAHHGTGCSATGNTCANQIKDAASVLKAVAIGIPASEVTVTFTALKSDHTTAATPVTCQLDACVTNTTTWPPHQLRQPGADIKIKADYTFNGAMCMVAPELQLNREFRGVPSSGYTHQFILF